MKNLLSAAVIIFYIFIAFGSDDTKKTQENIINTSPEPRSSNNYIFPNEKGNVHGKLIYSGSCYSGAIKGNAKCTIDNATGVSYLEYELGNYGYATEIGRITKEFEFSKSGYFKCKNETCKYAIDITETELNIFGYGWGARMVRIE
jgi:hypothetical protein